MNAEELSALKQKFEQFWAEIRGARLYAGQPRNAQSAAGVALARQALELATTAADDGLLLEARKMMYYSLTADEQYSEAIPYAQAAVAQCERRGEFGQAARIRIGEVSALTHAGRYEEALEVARVAEKWLKENDKIGYARLCTNVAILYFRTDQHKLSYEHYEMAAKVFEEAGDRQAAAQVYLNLANTLSWFDRFEESDSMYERTEEMAKELALDELWAQAHYNRAYLLYLRGRFNESLQGFARLRERFKNSGSIRHVALCDLDEIEIYLQFNLAKDAVTLAERAAAQFNQIGMHYEEAKAQAFHGVALMQMRRFGDAVEMFSLSRQGYEREGNQYWLGLLDLHRADVHLALGRYWEAQSLAAQARQRFEALGYPSRRMLSLVLLARIALALNKVSDAEKYVDQIEAITHETNAPLMLFPFYMLRGQIAELKAAWPDAQTAYAAAAMDLEEHQAQVQHDDLKVTFLHGRNQVYEALVRLSLTDEHASPRTAYSWCERAKSRGLVELLSQHLPSVQARGDHSLLNKIHALREELNVHYIRSKPESRSQSMAADFQAVTMKEQELARTLREVSATNSEYVSLQQVSIAELEEVQQFLPERTTLVEYFITREEVMAFVVSRNKAKAIRKLSPPNRLQMLQEKLTFQLEKFLLGEEFVRSHSEQIQEATLYYLQAFHKILVEPLLFDIETPHLVIVPHAGLHFLPFHALFDGSQHLIDRFEISYSPSASVLRYCLEKPDILDASPLLVGVPDEMAPLVDEEINLLNGLFPEAGVLRGEEATRQKFRLAARYSTFVHIATHASFRHDNPMFSNMKLADGYVTALDLFSMECRTNLAVLSGCQSGLGQVGGSDDLLGLMRGFFYAGARSLLMSLWSVNDESTVTLMKTFYTEWKRGSSKSKALQTAMQTVRDGHPNPFYWAPFVLVGKI
jgi:CHAT domain-containing protein